MKAGNEFETTLNPEQAANILHISKATLANWRSLRTGPNYIKIGNRCIYKRSEIERFLREHEVRLDE
jgi:predicted site-specific integrase-resolvase